MDFELHTPGIKMSIKVQYRDWSTIDLVKCSEGWKSNAMIATQCKQLGLRVGRVDECWGARAEFEEGGCHLAEGKGIVKRCNGDVTAIEDCIRRSVWI